MGIFSQNNRPTFDNFVVEAAEGYSGPGASEKIMFENYQNDMALFVGIIESDMQAANAEFNGAVTESTLITEGAVGDFFKKVKELFLKLIEKIKGLVNSFITKFAAVFVRDNKELVKKYHKTIVSKMNDSKYKYSEMTFKMHEVTYKEGLDALEGFQGKDTFFNKYKDQVLSAVKDGKMTDDINEELSQKLLSELNNNYGVNCGELGELGGQLKEKWLGEVDEFEGFDSQMFNAIEKTLTDSAKTVKEAEKIKKDSEKLCRDNIKAADQANKKALDLKDGETYAAAKGKNLDKDLAPRFTGAMYKLAMADQTWITTVCTTYLNCLKTNLKEQRSLYIKAAAFRGSVKESAELFSVIDEANDYEVDNDFDAAVPEDYRDEVEKMDMAADNNEA